MPFHTWIRQEITCINIADYCEHCYDSILLRIMLCIFVLQCAVADSMHRKSVCHIKLKCNLYYLLASLESFRIRFTVNSNLMCDVKVLLNEKNLLFHSSRRCFCDLCQPWKLATIYFPLYPVSQKAYTFLFLNNFVKNSLILIIFGVLNLEKISHESLTDLSISPVRCSHFTLGNPKKAFFSILILILQIIYISSEENR